MGNGYEGLVIRKVRLFPTGNLTSDIFSSVNLGVQLATLTPLLISSLALLSWLSIALKCIPISQIYSSNGSSPYCQATKIHATLVQLEKL